MEWSFVKSAVSFFHEEWLWCMHACMHMCVCMHVCVGMYAGVCAWMYVFLCVHFVTLKDSLMYFFISICGNCHVSTLPHRFSLQTTYLHSVSSYSHYRMGLVASFSAQAVPWGMLWPTHLGKGLKGKQRHKACGSCFVTACVTHYCDFGPVALPSWNSSNFCGIWVYFRGSKLFKTDQNLLSGKWWIPYCVMILEAEDNKSKGLWELSGLPSPSDLRNPQSHGCVGILGWEWVGFQKYGSEPEFSKQTQLSLKMGGGIPRI